MNRSIFLIASLILIISITLPIVSPLVIKANALYDEVVYGKEKLAKKQAPSSEGSIVVHFPANKNKPYLFQKVDPKLLDKNYLQKYLERKKALLESIARYRHVASTEYNSVDIIVKVKDINRFNNYLKASGLDKFVTVKETIKPLNVVVASIHTSNDIEYKRVLAVLSHYYDVSGVWLDDIFNITLFDTHVILGLSKVYQDFGVNGSGIKVAVLDTGVEINPELEGQVIAWKDFINNETTPYDDNGHGTFVSTIIAGKGVIHLLDGNGSWHSVNFDHNGEFNYAGPANLTYAINVSAYAGSSINISFLQRYWIEENYDYGYVKYKFDNGTWVTLDEFTGNGFDLQEKVYTISVPANATMLYLSFIYETDSSGQWGGWWLDDIKVYNATNASDVIFFDDVEGPMPSQVINATLWSRTINAIQGMAPGAKLMVGKVCSGSGGCPFDAILNGIVWATLGPDGQPNTGDEADIISMSLGGPASTYDILMQAVDWATYQYGKVVVVAAGNEGPGYYTASSPGVAHGAIAVGASTKVNTLAFFSSWGPSPVDYWIKPDIVAPGRHIISLIAGQPFDLPPGGYYMAVGSGTSFSTPHVSGIVALIKQAHPDWSPEEIRSALVSTTSIETIQPNAYTGPTVNPYQVGGGLVNPYRAINTTFLPVPAIVNFGEVLPINLPLNISANITLENFATSTAQVNVSKVELYSIDGVDYSSWVLEPVVNQTISIDGNSTATLTLKIEIPVDAPKGELYWGRIILSLNDGEKYQVIFGFYLAELITISGHVYDYESGSTLANVTVAAYSPDFATLYAMNISNGTGYYVLKVPSDTPLRITANFSGYYIYITTVYRFSSNTTFDIYMTKRYGYHPLQVLVVSDKTYGLIPWSTSEAANPSLFTAFNGTKGIIVRVWDNSIQGLAAPAILSGDFDAVVWLAAGVWYPVADELDYNALIEFANMSKHGVLLEGGDIGWFHMNDALMTNVAHAVFVNDMWPGQYTINVTKPGHMLSCCIPTVFDIDSAGTAPGSYGWPDAVEPVNNGYEVARWVSNNYSAIVAYNGFEYGGADTAYLAFPMASILNGSILGNITFNSLVWVLDHEPPVIPSNMTISLKIRYVNGTTMISVSWSPFEDLTPILKYKVYVNGTLVSETTKTMTEFTVSDNATYILKIEALDCKNRTTSMSILFYVPPYNVKGDYQYFRAPGLHTGTLSNTGVEYTMNTTGPAALHVVDLHNAKTVKLLGRTPRPYVPVTFLDIKVYNASNIDSLRLVIPYKENALAFREDSIKLYWFNTTSGKWQEVSNYKVNIVNNKIIVTFTNSSIPSLSDIGGTPFVIAAKPAILGGVAEIQYKGASSSSGYMAQLVAASAIAVLAAALLIVYRKRQIS